MFAALGLVFIAELGDKTQLVALGLGARHQLLPSLAGLSVAFAATSLISVLVGGLLGVALPTRAIGIAGGLLFLAFAVWTWREADQAEPESIEASPTARSAFISVAVAIGAAELGDKTMLATATLAGRGDPVAVWVGATTGLIAAGVVGVLAGRAIGARLPQRLVQRGAAVLFAVFGVVLLATSV